MLETLVQTAFAAARDVIVVNHKPLPPSWVLYGSDNNLMEVFATPWRNTTEKQLAEFLLRGYLKVKKVSAYAVAVEAWMSQQEKDWAPGQDPTWQGAAKAPNRVEVLIISAVSRSGENLFRSWKMIRDHHELVTDFVPMPDYGREASAVSWMLNLFQTKEEDDLNYSRFFEKP